MIYNLYNKKGAALLNAIVFISVLTTLGLAIAALTLFGFKYIARSHKNAQALNIAEAGIDKAFYEINKTGSTYSGENDTALGEGTFSVQIQSGSGNTKIITATGYIPNRNSYDVQKTVRVVAQVESSTTTVAFNYAVQIGDQGLTMQSNSTINGNAYSNGNILGSSNSKITGDAYAVTTISDPWPSAKSKHPNAPVSQMPSIDYNFWKTEAASGGTHQGDYSINDQQNLGPLKVNGNFSMNSNSFLTLKGPIYVTGNFELNSNSRLYLDQAFGSSGTIVIVDGTILLNSNSFIYSTNATPKGYILLVTTSTSANALELNSNSANGICYTLNGGMQVNSNGRAVAAVAKKLTLNSNATFDYDTGLADSIFTTGPGGKWIIKPGSWQKL